jgi:hypothetical protein
VIAERIGWTRGLTVLKDRIRELRPVYLPPDPASRTAYAAGEVAQCDLWFPAITLPVGFGQTRSAARLPVLVMVTGYARWLSARLIPSRVAEDLFAGWWQLIAQLGAVPRVLVTVLTEAAPGFRGVLGPRSTSATRPIPRPRAWSSGPTATWRARSCPAAASARRRTSTPSLATGWRWSTSDRGRCWAAPQPTGSRRTGRRCCPCRRSRHRPAGGPRCGCRATPTCGWTATTTRPTQRSSAAAGK